MSASLFGSIRCLLMIIDFKVPWRSMLVALLTKRHRRNRKSFSPAMPTHTIVTGEEDSPVGAASAAVAAAMLHANCALEQESESLSR
jgi:hypothetical protein